ncbi:Glycerol-3-phosphate acyltransferase [subsurface metagenome]
MYFVYLILLTIAAYLSGSVNYAIVITKLVRSQDIRQLGNRNPGTANVGRSIGKRWGALVFFLDFFKGFIPLLLARLFVFQANSYSDFFALFAMGIAAVGGHCKPVYYRFKGGGGVATSAGVFLFFIPVEFFVSMLLGAFIATIFIKNVQFKLTQWTPILFVTMTPFLTLGLNFLVDLPLFAHISIGGRPWYMIAGIFAISFFILFMNLSFMGRRLEECRQSIKQKEEQ